MTNAEDVLAGWLAHAEPKFINKPSKHDQLHSVSGELVPIRINESIIESYQEVKRFNVIFPRKILKAIDEYRKKAGLKRSALLQKTAEEYLEQHQN